VRGSDEIYLGIFLTLRFITIILLQQNNCCQPTTYKYGELKQEMHAASHVRTEGETHENEETSLGLGMAIIKASSSRLMRRSWDHYDVS
jgi:hypothetical protein